MIFILHTGQEQNCSTSDMRVIDRAHADPYVAVVGASAALYGPLHGGANEQVLRMLNEIGSIDRVPDYVERAFRLMGFWPLCVQELRPARQILNRMALEQEWQIGIAATLAGNAATRWSKAPSRKQALLVVEMIDLLNSVAQQRATAHHNAVACS